MKRFEDVLNTIVDTLKQNLNVHITEINNKTQGVKMLLVPESAYVFRPSMDAMPNYDTHVYVLTDLEPKEFNAGQTQLEAGFKIGICFVSNNASGLDDQILLFRYTRALLEAIGESWEVLQGAKIEPTGFLTIREKLRIYNATGIEITLEGA